jgi:hypothetical protein
MVALSAPRPQRVRQPLRLPQPLGARGACLCPASAVILPSCPMFTSSGPHIAKLRGLFIVFTQVVTHRGRQVLPSRRHPCVLSAPRPQRVRQPLRLPQPLGARGACLCPAFGCCRCLCPVILPRHPKSCLRVSGPKTPKLCGERQTVTDPVGRSLRACLPGPGRKSGLRGMCEGLHMSRYPAKASKIRSPGHARRPAHVPLSCQGIENQVSGSRTPNL